MKASVQQLRLIERIDSILRERVVLIEGERDAAALLSAFKPVAVVVASGRPQVVVSRLRRFSKRGIKVALLLDLDQEGDALTRRWSELLTYEGIAFETRTRALLGRLGVVRIEEVPTIIKKMG